MASNTTTGRPQRLPFTRQILFRTLAIAVVCVGAIGYLVLRDSFNRAEMAVTPLGLTSPAGHPQANAVRKVSELEIPAVQVLNIAAMDSLKALHGADAEPDGLVLNQPSDFALAGDRLYVLDGGNGRVVEFDASGQPLAAIDKSLDPRLRLHSPMSMAARDGKLYIADSDAARILVLDPRARVVEQEIPLNKLAEGEELPRPIGIALTSAGDILVSDASNHRVLKRQADGAVSVFAGTGKRDGGSRGLNTPGGLALDVDGNVYVVDILNGRAVKYSPSGQYLLQFGRPGDTAGAFSRPKGVAVDQSGNVYVSDSLQAAVQGFDAKANYTGLIGRKEPGNKDSESVFQAPAELEVVAGRLYVTDRLAGPFVFDLAARS